MGDEVNVKMKTESGKDGIEMVDGDVKIKEEIFSEEEDEAEDFSLNTRLNCPICHAMFDSCEQLQLHIGTHRDEDSNIGMERGNVAVKDEPLDEITEKVLPRTNNNDSSEYNGNKKLKSKAKKRRPPNSKLKILSCDECEYATTHWSNLRTHKRKHTGERPFACDKCEYRSAQLVHLKEHMYIHQEVEPEFPCPKCDQIFNRPHTLRRHIKRHMTQKIYACKYCDHKALGEILLRNHIKHTHMPGYKCPECTYIGKTASQLKRHMVIRHSTNKAYKCDFCDYKTHNSNHLVTHVRVHTKEKPFKCNECSYASTQKNHLMTHIRSHNGEKPYGCEFCSYTSTQATHVKAHRRIHTGERPYQCVECVYATKTATELRKHRLRHHPREGDPVKALLECNLCDYTCKMGRQLRQHRAKKHPEDSNGNVKRGIAKKAAISSADESNANLTVLPIEVECSIPIIKTEIIVEDDEVSY